tara:strand:- start:32 stop:253 length:222 start_codon:yes stop_codon:yes gene_type:complete
LFIHRLSTALVHCGLLVFNRPKLLLQLPAFRHLAILLSALTRVNLKQRPDASAYVTPALHFGLTFRTMREKVL